MDSKIPTRVQMEINRIYAKLYYARTEEAFYILQELILKENKDVLDDKKFIDIVQEVSIKDSKFALRIENLYSQRGINLPLFTSRVSDLETINIVAKPIWGKLSQNEQFQVDVFVILPFTDTFMEIFNTSVATVTKSLGYTTKHAGEVFSQNSINQDIWSLIYNCKLVIADCTGQNPNVFYELGIAHTMGKPTIMITQNVADLPFDVKDKRAILYKNTPDGKNKLKDELKKIINLINS